MNRIAAAVCKAFIEKGSAEKKQQLLKLLPEQTQQQFQELSSSFKNPALGFQNAGAYLKEMHPSWLATLLRMLPKSEITLFLSCLSSKQADELKKLLLYSTTLIRLTPSARAFLQESLFNKLKTEEILPLECLPSSHLNALLSLSYPQLQRLIRFLGLHDLAVEMKQIIETARLKQLNAALDNEEQLYIKRLLQKKEGVVFKKLSLDKWKGDKESLQNALEKRGLNRLAKALFGQDRSLIWYVKHLFDTDRAESIETHCIALDHPDAVRLLVDQTTFLISHLKKGKKSS